MIAYRPVRADKRGGNIPNAVVSTALTRHPDGFGVAWRADGALLTKHFGPKEADAFRAHLRSVDNAGHEYVAHFRYGTHGPNDVHHAHPFEYADPEVGRVLVFHNGVIDIATTAAESDTEVFVRDVLAHLPSRWWESPALRYLVGEAIGWSKLVIMTAEETINLHEKRGSWDGGIWYSSEHRPYTYKPTTNVVALYGSSATQSGSTAKPWQASTYKATAPDKRMTGKHKHKARKAERSCTVPGAEASGTPLLLPETASSSFINSLRRRHAGHEVEYTRPINFEAEFEHAEDSVTCITCGTAGDVWVLDGQEYIDMAHRHSTRLTTAAN